MDGRIHHRSGENMDSDSGIHSGDDRSSREIQRRRSSNDYPDSDGIRKLDLRRLSREERSALIRGDNEIEVFEVDLTTPRSIHGDTHQESIVNSNYCHKDNMNIRRKPSLTSQKTLEFTKNGPPIQTLRSIDSNESNESYKSTSSVPSYSENQSRYAVFLGDETSRNQESSDSTDAQSAQTSNDFENDSRFSVQDDSEIGSVIEAKPDDYRCITEDINSGFCASSEAIIGDSSSSSSTTSSSSTPSSAFSQNQDCSSSINSENTQLRQFNQGYTTNLAPVTEDDIEIRPLSIVGSPTYQNTPLIVIAQPSESDDSCPVSEFDFSSYLHEPKSINDSITINNPLTRGRFSNRADMADMRGRMRSLDTTLEVYQEENADESLPSTRSYDNLDRRGSGLEKLIKANKESFKIIDVKKEEEGKTYSPIKKNFSQKVRHVFF